MAHNASDYRIHEYQLLSQKPNPSLVLAVVFCSARKSEEGTSVAFRHMHGYRSVQNNTISACLSLSLYNSKTLDDPLIPFQPFFDFVAVFGKYTANN